MKLPFLEFSRHPDISERVRYHISQLVDYFHAVPHFDVNLQPVNGTFDPYNNIYLEVSPPQTFPYLEPHLARFSHSRHSGVEYHSIRGNAVHVATKLEP